MTGWWAMPFPEDPSRGEDPSSQHSGERDLAEPPDLSRQLARRLRKDPRLDGAHLRVTVVDGVAVVQGAVSSREAQRAASEHATDLPGVRDVLNLLDYPRV